MTEPLDKKKDELFQFTKPSRDELRYKRNVISYYLLCFAYLALVIVITVLTQESLVLISLILLFNIMVVFKLGGIAISALVFPYSQTVIKQGFNNSSS